MAEENNNNFSTVLKTPIMVLVLTIVIAGYLIGTQIAPKVQELTNLHSNYSTKMDEYTQKEQQLETLKSTNAAKANATAASLADLSKEFFKPLESGMDTETIIASEFNEVLSLMTSNAIKTRSIKTAYDPQDDNFVKGAPDKYSVCKLDMEMIASYTNFKNFLKDLYKHEHYLDIAKVEIIPYPKNKAILLINLQLKLYAEKA